MDRYRQLETFVRVVEAGSFVAAADALGISKAAASRGVLELEARLGARLLHRTTRRLAPTEAGRAYFERAQQILADLAAADAHAAAGLQGTPATVAGVLRVAVPHSFGVRHLAPLWPALLAAHPGLELDLTLSDRLVDLDDEGYDVALRITHTPHPAHGGERLARMRLLTCASPQYLAEHGVPARPADLARHRVIAYAYAPQGDAWQFETAGGVQEVLVHARLRANDGETCRAAALAHLGIIRQPAFMVADDLAAGRLQVVLPDARVPVLGVWAVYPSRRRRPARVRALVEFLARAFAGAGWAEPD